MMRLLSAIRRKVFPIADIECREYGSLGGGSYCAWYPVYCLFGKIPVKMGWKKVVYSIEEARKLREV